MSSSSSKVKHLQHLKELKKRLSIAVLAYLMGVFVLMNFAQHIYAFIAEPLRSALPDGSHMIFIGAPDVFFTYLKVTLVVSLFATAPITLYQLWRFITPALYQQERRIFAGYFISSLFLLLAGAAFAYYAVFPLVFQFFMGFSTPDLQAFPDVREYFSFALKLLFAFGLSFQIPIVLMLLSRLQLIDPNKLAKQRRFVILWIFICAALLTPPDVISQIFLAVPMLLLFELGLLLAKYGRRHVNDNKNGQNGQLDKIR
ncbi:MAG: twin-arginine translocase subunit TatC [Mariprofundales bacterium]